MRFRKPTVNARLYSGGKPARLIACVNCTGWSVPVRKAGCAHTDSRANISTVLEIVTTSGDFVVRKKKGSLRSPSVCLLPEVLWPCVRYLRCGLPTLSIRTVATAAVRVVDRHTVEWRNQRGGGGRCCRGGGWRRIARHWRSRRQTSTKSAAMRRYFSEACANDSNQLRPASPARMMRPLWGAAPSGRMRPSRSRNRRQSRVCIRAGSRKG